MARARRGWGGFLILLAGLLGAAIAWYDYNTASTGIDHSIAPVFAGGFTGDEPSTPQLVKTVISKLYVAWVIDRQYSEDDDLSAYAALLRGTAQTLMAGIVSSEIDIPGAALGSSGDGLPSVYPTDNDPICGPAFTMDAVF